MVMDKNIESVSVVGLGKLGLPLACVLASEFYQVVGVDKSRDIVNSVNTQTPHIREKYVKEYLTQYGENIHATEDINAVKDTDLTMVIVPTPSRPDGAFTSKYVIDACKGIGHAIRNKDTFHQVAIVSTVMPGTTDGILKEIIQEYSGGICGEDFLLYYNPEFIAPGSVIHDMRRPDFILLGDTTEITRMEEKPIYLEEMYRKICGQDIPIARMYATNAEIAKLAINSYVTMKISYANTLSQMCEQYVGGNVDDVTLALGYDSRIGKKYLKGALGYGGTRLPRDNRAFSYMANQLGINPYLAVATDTVNESQMKFIIDKIALHARPDDFIGILGLSYKPNTDVVDESQALVIALALATGGFGVIVHDPCAMENAKRYVTADIGDNIFAAKTIEDLLKNSDIAVITTPWENYRSLTAKDFSHCHTVIDCWGILPGLERHTEQFAYHKLGTCSGDWL